MGLLNNILENDLYNFDKALQTDKVILEAEQQFYEFLKDTDQDFLFAMEKIFGTFTTRGMRIAYIQGLKDFNELFIDLKADTADILADHVKSL